MFENNSNSIVLFVRWFVCWSIFVCAPPANQIARIPFLRNRKDAHPVFVTSAMRFMHDHVYPKVINALKTVEVYPTPFSPSSNIGIASQMPTAS